MLETLGFDRFYVRGEGCFTSMTTPISATSICCRASASTHWGAATSSIIDALHQALDANLPNLVQLDRAVAPGALAEALVARAHDGIERVFFSNSGAEAIESAIKFARPATKRSRILYCDHAFHGLTTGALSLNGGAEFRPASAPLLDTEMVPFGDLAALSAALRGDDVAALVIEPIQGMRRESGDPGVLVRGRGLAPQTQDPARRG